MTPAELAETVQWPAAAAGLARSPEPEWPEMATPVDHRAAMTGLVTLFLVLVGFFAMLTGLATEERGRAVAASASLAATFARTPPPQQAPLPDGAERYKREIEGVFAGTFDQLKADLSRGSWVAGFAAAEDDMFATGRNELTQNGQALVAKVAATLRGAPAGLRHGVEITLPAPLRGERTTLASDRAGALIRNLLAAEVPAASIAVGIRDGRERRLTFVFLSAGEGA
jgi:hypothetical protein